MSEFHFDVSLREFETRVIAASQTVPVLVDFWAKWCEPCQTLKPMLEKLAEEYQGRFLLAKVDADENPELCQYFGIRSVPTVVALAGGQSQDAFSSVLPEPELRAFIDRFALPPKTDPRGEAALLAQSGDWEGALKILRQAIKDSPDHEGLRLDIAEALLELKRKEEAALFLEQDYAVEADRARALKVRLSLSAKASDIAPLLEKISTCPDDLNALLELSSAYAGNGQYEEAMEAALETVRKNRLFENAQGQSGRGLLLEFFTALSGNEYYDDLVRKYRRALSALLN